MKNLSYISLLISFIFSSNLLTAQVSFTSSQGLLNLAPGSAEDCAVDMNGDYLDDVVRISGGSMYIDYQQADGSFTQQVFNVGFQNSPSWSLCAGDIDGNGFNDLLFGGGNAVSFIYADNTGSSYSEDYHQEYIFSQRSTFADIDNDGNLDAFVCHDVDQSHPYRNDGNGNLVLDQTFMETYDAPGNYSAIWVDYDNDGDSDMYVTKCKLGSTSGDPHRTNLMYRNNGDGTYSEVAEDINLADNSQSWTTVFEDFDNDGDFDAFIVNHDFKNRLMKNNNGIFEDVIIGSGIDDSDLGAWEAMGGDFNNDGFVDIIAQMNNELYLNNGDMTFTGYSNSFSNGGIGDLNNDGFLDAVRGSTVYLNDGNDNNWIKINTEGIISNRNGIGARVEIHGSWGVQIREIRSGQSFSPMSSLNVHFGIGQATSINQLIIKWPSGIITTIDNPAINTTHWVPETNCLLTNSEVTVTGDTELCTGETVTLQAPAGYETYQWSNGETTATITVSTSGNYSVNSSDATGCISISNSVLVTEIMEIVPTASLIGDEVICKGESVTLTVDQGANPIWSNGMTGNTIEVTESGNYFVDVEGICSATPLSSNAITVEVIEAPLPVADDVEIVDPGIATLTAIGDNLSWYDVATGGIPLGTGSTFETPFLDVPQTFYVESDLIQGGELADGGKTEIGSSGGLTGVNGYSYFDAYESFTILSVRVLVPNEGVSGIREIQLADEVGNILQTASFDLEIGEHVLDLNFEVPVGNQLSLRCPQNDMFRNNTNVNYPYPISDVGEITTSNFGNNYYYYFYDWKIQKREMICTSDRVPVDVSILTNNDELGKIVTNVSVYPNPASEKVFINFESSESQTIQINMLDITGKKVLKSKELETVIGKNLIDFDVNKLPKGMYYFQINADGKSIGWKITVQ